MKLGLAAMAIAFAVGTVGAVGPANADDWPTKPVKIISPFAAGGGSDAAARILAENLGRQFGQQFYVENRGGAGGLIGTAMVAAAPPDGYTFVVSSITTHVLAPITAANPEYDPIRNFTHIAFIGGPPTVIVAHPSLGVKTFRDLLTKLKGSKDPLPYSSAGPGTIGNLICEYLAEKEDVKLTHVAYKGAGQAISDLIAGHVKLGSLTSTAARAQMKAGMVIPLAFSSADRVPEFPDVPTLKELGYPDLVATAWFGIAAPAGLPQTITDRMSQGVNRALDAPEVRKRLTDEGFEIATMTPAELTDYIRREGLKWGPLAKRLTAQGAR